MHTPWFGALACLQGVVAAVASGGQSGLLAALLHRAVASLAPEAGAGPCGVSFVEALLSLVGALVASTSGAQQQFRQCCPLSNISKCSCCRDAAQLHGADFAAGQAASRGPKRRPLCPAPCLRAGTQALSEAGLIPALLPLLRDAQPDHVPLVASTVRILEAFMDFRWARLMCAHGGLWRCGVEWRMGKCEGLGGVVWWGAWCLTLVFCPSIRPAVTSPLAPCPCAAPPLAPCSASWAG